MTHKPGPEATQLDLLLVYSAMFSGGATSTVIQLSPPEWLFQCHYVIKCESDISTYLSYLVIRKDVKCSFSLIFHCFFKIYATVWHNSDTFINATMVTVSHFYYKESQIAKISKQNHCAREWEFIKACLLQPQSLNHLLYVGWRSTCKHHSYSTYLFLNFFPSHFETQQNYS